jgi:hypothetical protein
MSRRQTRLRYDAFVAAAHVHPAQTETLEVIEGTLAAKIAGKTLEAEPRLRPQASRAHAHTRARERASRYGLPLPASDLSYAGAW